MLLPKTKPFFSKNQNRLLQINCIKSYSISSRVNENYLHLLAEFSGALGRLTKGDLYAVWLEEIHPHP